MGRFSSSADFDVVFLFMPAPRWPRLRLSGCQSSGVKAGRWWRAEARRSEGARQRREPSRRRLVFGGSEDPDHDAVMRIRGEAPRWRAHSPCGTKAMRYVGLPPPRTVIGSSRRLGSQLPTSCLGCSFMLLDAKQRRRASRRSLPIATARLAAFVQAQRSWSCGCGPERRPSAPDTIVPAHFPSGT